jgi:hypothetical protein
MAWTEAGFQIYSDMLFESLWRKSKVAGMRSGPGIQPGEGRIKACIKSHLTELSPTSQDVVLTVAVTGKVCKTDVTKLCGGIEPGTGGIRACIKSHMAEVSDPCKDAMSRASAGRKILGHEDL